MGNEQEAGLFAPGADVPAGGTAETPAQPPSQPAENAGAEAEPKFVTESALEEKLELLSREIQSTRDKALYTENKKLKARFDAIEKDVAAWREQGIEITAQQVKDRKMAAMQDTLVSSDAQSPGTNDDLTSSPAPDIVSQTNARAEAISKELGVRVDADDPEAKLLEQSSPAAFLASYRLACWQKSQRVGGEERDPQCSYSFASYTTTGYLARRRCEVH